MCKKYLIFLCFAIFFLFPELSLSLGETDEPIEKFIDSSLEICRRNHRIIVENPFVKVKKDSERDEGVNVSPEMMRLCLLSLHPWNSNLRTFRICATVVGDKPTNGLDIQPPDSPFPFSDLMNAFGNVVAADKKEELFKLQSC